MATSIGGCITGTCESLEKNREQSHRSFFSEEIATKLSDIYVDTYLSKLSRLPPDRDIHYNKTIENTRVACKKDLLLQNDVEVRFQASNVATKCVYITGRTWNY